MVQGLGPLSLTWVPPTRETWMEVWAPSFGLTQPWCKYSRSKPADGRFLFLCHSVFLPTPSPKQGGSALESQGTIDASVTMAGAAGEMRQAAMG